MNHASYRQTGKSETVQKLREYQDKMIHDFQKILTIIESDYFWEVDGARRNHADIPWDGYQMILNNYIVCNFTGDKGWKMQRDVEELITAETEDFAATTNELFTRFSNVVMGTGEKQ